MFVCLKLHVKSIANVWLQTHRTTAHLLTSNILTHNNTITIITTTTTTKTTKWIRMWRMNLTKWDAIELKLKYSIQRMSMKTLSIHSHTTQMYLYLLATSLQCWLFFNNFFSSSFFFFSSFRFHFSFALRFTLFASVSLLFSSLVLSFFQTVSSFPFVNVGVRVRVCHAHVGTFVVVVVFFSRSNVVVEYLKKKKNEFLLHTKLKIHNRVRVTLYIQQCMLPGLKHRLFFR